MQSLVFNVPDGQDADVCFIKIFISMKAVDIGPIEQPETPCADAKMQSVILVLEIPVAPSGPKWASEIITIISKHNTSMISKILLHESWDDRPSPTDTVIQLG
ncbi:hypothetical protein EDD18DRAFT_1116585 [Armillaria luteobubalina]|uniref:Uncharacterized protein n=1 Tax=Armillaria luteobubalina TaxID=153913 RepID=A0AA39U9P9_9AGAR|nr:hypothetical protein EDD18DRAFT_1116585 [Armillaria luteobubalina]